MFTGSLGEWYQQFFHYAPSHYYTPEQLASAEAYRFIGMQPDEAARHVQEGRLLSATLQNIFERVEHLERVILGIDVIGANRMGSTRDCTGR